MEYLKVKKPKVFFLSLGETDEWAHEGEYDRYLDAANMSDRLFGELWSTVQKMPEYRGKTTLIIATDHGRGGAPRAWESHGANISGAEDIWLAVLGPDTPALGEIKSSKLTQSQIAATIVKALGKNYSQVQPRAAVPAPVFNR
jgi:arylsulfatase A-like enzyme